MRFTLLLNLVRCMPLRTKLFHSKYTKKSNVSSHSLSVQPIIISTRVRDYVWPGPWLVGEVVDGN